MGTFANLLTLCFFCSIAQVYGLSIDSTTQVVPQGSWTDLLYASSGVYGYDYFVNAAGRDSFKVRCPSPTFAPV
jgi:hypothetical protein